MPASDPLPQPGFVEVDGRRLFVQHYRPTQAVVARVLVLPALAEEMNTARRLVAMSAAALVAGGCEVLVPDVYGTGDSAGEFGEATLSLWQADLAGAASSLMDDVDVLLSVRGGSLLVDGVCERLDVAPRGIVALQPVLRGDSYLQQLMRVRLMADKLAGGSETADELRARWSRGDAVELSGYAISAALADAISAAKPAFGACGRVRIIECRGGDKTQPSTAVARFTASLKGAASDATCEVVAAEQFWTSQEVSAPPAIADAVAAACAWASSAWASSDG